MDDSFNEMLWSLARTATALQVEILEFNNDPETSTKDLDTILACLYLQIRQFKELKKRLESSRKPT